jgi:hypothetical protein
VCEEEFVECPQRELSARVRKPKGSLECQEVSKVGSQAAHEAGAHRGTGSATERRRFNATRV